VLILLTWWILGSPPRIAAAWRGWLVWILAWPILAVLVALNLGYTKLLRAIFAGYSFAEEEYLTLGLDDPFWTIGLFCVTAALLEELFYRYLLLGHIRPWLGMHSAVWITALIFGMAHLGNWIGWPILMLVGAGLGYARVYSGSLLLPMLLHGVHNFVILWVQQESLG